MMEKLQETQTASPTRVAILGAGPAGLSTAKYLSTQKCFDITIFESKDRTGGLMNSVEYEGDHFDVGTILFSSNHGLIDAFPQLREELQPIKYSPRAINPKGRIDKYPFTIHGYVSSYGLKSMLKSIAEVCIAKVKYRKKQSVAEFAKYYMGQSFYKQSGLQNYIHRLHELPDTELDFEFASKRLVMIQRQSFRAIAKRLVGIGRNNKKIGGSMMVRPRSGFPAMFDMIMSELINHDVTIETGVSISSIRRVGSEFVITIGEKAITVDQIVSTIPIGNCLKLLGFTSSCTPRTKGLLSLYFRGTVSIKGNTFFNFSYDGRWKRMTVFSRFYGESNHVAGPDWFTVEVTSNNNDEKTVKELVEEFSLLNDRFSILAESPKFLGHSYTEDAYPLYTKENVQNVSLERKKLAELGVHILGRQGNFEYVISNIVARHAKAVSSKLSPKEVT